MTYRKNDELLEGFEFKDIIKEIKRVDNNTLRIVLNDDTIIYRLHNTNIITIKNKIIVYNSGGYRSITTKDRMNKFTPLNHTIYQKNHIWYIKNGDKTHDFYDGIGFGLDGKLVSEIKEINNKLWNKCKKEISKFASLINDLESIPKPSAGDCWYCCMVNQDGKTMGELSNDYSHLVSHIKKGYLHGSLILNALKDVGRTDIFIASVFGDTDFGLNFKDIIRRDLRHYLTKRILNEKYYKLECIGF